MWTSFQLYRLPEQQWCIVLRGITIQFFHSKWWEPYPWLSACTMALVNQMHPTVNLVKRMARMAQHGNCSYEIMTASNFSSSLSLTPSSLSVLKFRDSNVIGFHQKKPSPPLSFVTGLNARQSEPQVIWCDFQMKIPTNVLRIDMSILVSTNINRNECKDNPSVSYKITICTPWCHHDDEPTASTTTTTVLEVYGSERKREPQLIPRVVRNFRSR